MQGLFILSHDSVNKRYKKEWRNKMSEKVFDVEAVLNEEAVRIKIKDKIFVVKDVSEEVQNMLTSLEDKGIKEQREVVAKLVGCDVELLKEYGVVALSKMMSWINENLFPKVSQ